MIVEGMCELRIQRYCTFDLRNMDASYQIRTTRANGPNVPSLYLPDGRARLASRGARGRRLLLGERRRYQSLPSRPGDNGARAVRLAELRRSRGRLRHLGDALHRDARV